MAVKVQCPRCKDKFKVEDWADGGLPCPKCGYILRIPTEENATPVEHTTKEASGSTLQTQNKSLTVGSMWRLFSYGWLMTLSGIIIMTLASGMDVSVYASGIGAVANIDKMNQRSDWIMIGLGLFISGVLTLGMSAIHRTIIRAASQKLR